MGKRKYDGSQRRLHAALKKAKETLESLESAEHAAYKKGGMPRAERKRANRAEHLPKDRMCPTCGAGPLMSSRAWVITTVAETLAAQCLRCFRNPETSFDPEKAKAWLAKVELARTKGKLEGHIDRLKEAATQMTGSEN